MADETFVANRTEGFEELKKEILALDVDEMERLTGVDRNLVREATHAYASSKAAMEFHGLGVTEHSQGTFAIQLIADLVMITGNIGKPGAGMNPLRGQNNVQGAADMGAQPHQGAGYLDVTDPEMNHRYNTFYKRDVPSHMDIRFQKCLTLQLVGI